MKYLNKIDGIVVLAGALCVFGFAPFGLFLIPVLALAVLFALLQKTTSARGAARLGFYFGLGLFGAGISWVYVALHDFGSMPMWLSAPATLLFAAFLALFPALAAYVQARLPAARALRLLGVMPAVWVLVEGLRGMIFTGFPWLTLGYAHSDSPLAGYAPLLGVYGVSWLAAVSAGLLAWLGQALTGGRAGKARRSLKSVRCYSSPDKTTGGTTSHLTKAASCQVIGYSHSTKPASGQVAGYEKGRPEGHEAGVYSGQSCYSSPEEGRLGGVKVFVKSKPPLTPPFQGENSSALIYPPEKHTPLTPPSTRKEYAGGDPAAAQRPCRCQGENPSLTLLLLIFLLLLIWGGGALLRTVAWTQPWGEPLSVALVQGNIGQEQKFNDNILADTLETYRRMVLQSDARLTVLPETALPLLRHQVPTAWSDPLQARAQHNGGDVLIGIFERESGNYYNSVFSLGSAAEQHYRKQHLVPFGEFIPLRPLLGWFINGVLDIPMGDLARGAARQAPLDVAGQRVAVNICYEDVFGEEIIQSLPQATLLVNVTNDAWYGHSRAAEQHNQIAQLRALETGRMLLRATNTGVTAIIGADGKVLQQLAQHRQATLLGKAQGYQGSTPYVRWGNGAIWLLLASILAYAWRYRA